MAGKCCSGVKLSEGKATETTVSLDGPVEIASPIEIESSCESSLSVTECNPLDLSTLEDNTFDTKDAVSSLASSNTIENTEIKDSIASLADSVISGFTALAATQASIINALSKLPVSLDNICANVDGAAQYVVPIVRGDSVSYVNLDGTTVEGTVEVTDDCDCQDCTECPEPVEQPANLFVGEEGDYIDLHYWIEEDGVDRALYSSGSQASEEYLQWMLDTFGQSEVDNIEITITDGDIRDINGQPISLPITFTAHLDFDGTNFSPSRIGIDSQSLEDVFPSGSSAPTDNLIFSMTATELQG